MDSIVHKERFPATGPSRVITLYGPSAFIIFKSWDLAQMVKNLPAMQETWIRSLGWEDPLEKGKAAHSSILA